MRLIQTDSEGGATSHPRQLSPNSKFSSRLSTASTDNMEAGTVPWCHGTLAVIHHKSGYVFILPTTTTTRWVTVCGIAALCQPDNIVFYNLQNEMIQSKW